jgi:hypothetical protein
MREREDDGERERKGEREGGEKCDLILSKLSH